jgi:hypothetical protein
MTSRQALAYAEVSQEPPEGDLYDVSELVASYDRTNKDHRDTVKAAFNSLLNGGKAQASDILAGLQRMGRVRPKAMIAALVSKHLPLRGILGTNVGLRLTNLESQIMVGVLERLRKENVVALPIHDGVLVALSDTIGAVAATEERSYSVSGFRLPVDVEVLV